MQRLKALIAEYGPYAIGTYLVIFAVAMVGFALAIRFGVQPTGVAGEVGTLAGAWLATKATQPLRVAATFVLTPLVARLMRRRAPSAPEVPMDAAASSPTLPVTPEVAGPKV